MGYDMRNEFNLFPRDFRKAHYDKSKEYNGFKDKQAKDIVKIVSYMFNLLFADILIQFIDSGVPPHVKILPVHPGISVIMDIAQDIKIFLPDFPSVS